MASGPSKERSCQQGDCVRGAVTPTPRNKTGLHPGKSPASARKAAPRPTLKIRPSRSAQALVPGACLITYLRTAHHHVTLSPGDSCSRRPCSAQVRGVTARPCPRPAGDPAREKPAQPESSLLLRGGSPPHPQGVFKWQPGPDCWSPNYTSASVALRSLWRRDIRQGSTRSE